jgi:hypothetical protein
MTLMIGSDQLKLSDGAIDFKSTNAGFHIWKHLGQIGPIEPFKRKTFFILLWGGDPF